MICNFAISQQIVTHTSFHPTSVSPAGLHLGPGEGHGLDPEALPGDGPVRVEHGRDLVGGGRVLGAGQRLPVELAPVVEAFGPGRAVVLGAVVKEQVVIAVLSLRAGVDWVRIDNKH